jgi:hypothetical protein|tara:strand:+ start:1167 stop:1412 length:246 start_codon:yes stop_codon:yes gene_type:complete
MDKPLLRLTVYAALLDLVSDPDYYYHSSVGKEYSHFSDKGKQAIVDFVEIFAHTMLEVKHEEDIERSKGILLSELKGKHDY